MRLVVTRAVRPSTTTRRENGEACSQVLVNGIVAKRVRRR